MASRTNGLWGWPPKKFWISCLWQRIDPFSKRLGLYLPPFFAISIAISFKCLAGCWDILEWIQVDSLIRSKMSENLRKIDHAIWLGLSPTRIAIHFNWFSAFISWLANFRLRKHFTNGVTLFCRRKTLLVANESSETRCVSLGFLFLPRRTSLNLLAKRRVNFPLECFLVFLAGLRVSSISRFPACQATCVQVDQTESIPSQALLWR